MKPELLKTFLAVCEHGNFTRAAEARLLTQPAVSRQIKQLESQLGVPLFEHRGKSIHLTDAARALVPQAADLLGRLERVVESVRRFRSPGRGRLRIGASTTPGYYVLPAILGEFHRDHPEVELAYIVENTLSIEQRIVRNELDVAFVGAHLVNAALRIERLLDDRIVCICGSGHALAGRKRVAPEVLRDTLWVVREKGSATRQLFEQRLATVGVEIGRAIEINSPEGIKEIVGAGIGISFMSAYGLQRELADGRLRPLPVRELRLSRPIYTVRHAEKHESPTMNAFLKLVRARATRLRS